MPIVAKKAGVTKRRLALLEASATTSSPEIATGQIPPRRPIGTPVT
jgi:hypothetical protein